MTGPFDSFVIFAEMRTGSNFLESNLDQFPGLQCYGEAFNPYFMVSPQTEELFGITVAMRDANPMLLLERMKSETEGLPGFRFFHDHDPRMFNALIDDPRCAKIILTRNPVEAYVSRRIAMATDQWQLSDQSDARKERARFIPDDFEKLFYRFKSFQLKVKDRLQRSGQTAFYIDYEEVQNLSVVNGLAKYLGEKTEIANFASTFKKQNPEPLSDKVQNLELLAATVARIDVFDLHRIPNFEPGRPPAMKSYMASDELQLVFLPIAGGPSDQVTEWMEAAGPLTHDFSQKALRQWKRRHKAHRSFTVLRHPVARLHSVFCDLVTLQEDDPDWDLKHSLRHNYGVALPTTVDTPWALTEHQSAFAQFIAFVAKTLSGQTSIGVDPRWASQTAVVNGFAGFSLPDHILREDQLAAGLSQMLTEVQADVKPALPAPISDGPFSLAQVYSDKIETVVRKAYQRDYMMFGFGPWSALD
ncbi:sulfotransferase family 2 domain-containing protein [Aliiroseovarius sp. F47248L]|uniref:sulfotransferase family 2 domain-containing protein n=1 Tax=Aliiroseovarius sp. F47248L TaxID=2926420 RepID=UPI001FF11612|nr:sulfotransferase family 2 domain-containing protein [Aliiroseovarius sp. F47248L]MCK0140215.1 sulfotransferase family 2 domain-containing protein [Aliiroseovarius sp. F47248L]